jgi:signal transduction histidine kinase
MVTGQISTEASQKKLSLRAHLILLVSVALIPILIFAGSLIAFLAHQQQESVDINLRGTTRAIAAAVDEQMTAIVSSLQILAVVEDFDRSYLPDLHRRLIRYVKSQNSWISISLAHSDGTQIFNTATGLRDPLPSWVSQPLYKQLMKTGQPSFSGYRLTMLKKVPAVSIAVPVKNKGRIEYLLIASVAIDAVAEVLNRQKLPEKWTSTILDSNSLILARSRAHEKYVGTQAPSYFSEILRKKYDGTFKAPTQEGEMSFGAFSRSRGTDWTIVLSMPVSNANFTTWKMFWFIVGGGGLMLLISFALTILVSRRISKPIVSLSGSAAALGRGETVQPLPTSVAELSDVADALVNASIERNSSEERMKDLYHQAQEAVELRDTFLSIASHELKTPLTTLKLQFQLLDKNIKGAEMIETATLVKPFNRVLDQVRRLTLLVDDLLDVSRIAANRMDLHPENVELTSLVREIISQFEDEASKTGSTMSLKHLHEIEGHWDRGRLEQVFTNLISNAIKYGDGKEISVHVHRTESEITIDVTDLGLGVAEEDQKRIFQRFERAAGIRTISGLGLGLWITERIVEKLGGKISLISSLGKGSTFRVVLPINKI